jgi:hypothetical protein
LNDKRRPNDCWPAGAKVIEFGARDHGLGESLQAAGFRYLQVVDSEPQRQRLARQPNCLVQATVVSRDPQRVRQNNADVLILRGGAASRIARFREIRHARFIACPVANGPLLLWTLLFWWGQFLLGRLTWPRIVDVGKIRLVSFRVRRPRPYTATRRFVPHALGIDGFFAALRDKNMRHAVLRWFEDLPHVASGEDLDLLVDDVSLAAVRNLLDSGPGIQKVDLYSVYGAHGADYRKLPYYPPYLAEELLDGAILHRELCAVPSPRDHFLSLAYHAVYHKGHSSGLPADGRSRPKNLRPEHDYPVILAELAQQQGIEVPITIADLDAYLDTQGWRPPHDMLVRLARKNRALRSLVGQGGDSATDAGLAVFLVRRAALERGGVRRAEQLLANQGFHVVETIHFATDRMESIARSLRGGNWGAGPWPTSGGEPVAAIVVRDPAPIQPTRHERRKFPFLANARLLGKEAIRDAFNANRPAAEHCNVIHSSDNDREARDYLRVICPEQAAGVIERASQPNAQLRRAA